MPRGTQAKLPATLPTPAQARATLANARRTFAEKRELVDGLERRLKTSRELCRKLEADLDTAETDLLDADEGSAADLEAQARHLKALQSLDREERSRDEQAANLPYVKAELAQAAATLRGARGDLRAIGEGRRVR